MESKHTAHVSAASLYEAVALGLHAIRRSAWAGQIPGGLTPVTVRVLQVPVEHTVSLQAFRRWLEQPGTTPAERTARARLKEILSK